LTDYGLAIECAVFCVLIAKTYAPRDALRRWWIVFFASIGVGSFFGGTVHGFFHDERTPGYAILWPATLLAIGVTSLATWTVAAYAQLHEPARSWVRRGSLVLFAAYAYVVLFVSGKFMVAIIAYLPATLFLLVAMMNAYRRSGERRMTYGVAALLLTFVAAAVQQLPVSIHPVYFNHNALYHVIQAVALVLLFLTARVTRAREQPAVRTT
jgi:hypothetical protein